MLYNRTHMLAVNVGRISPLPVVVSISAARVILNAKVREERTITLFDRLNWIPFYDEININKCCIIVFSELPLIT